MSGLILAIETSCDETAAAVLADGRRVLSSVVASQDDVHAAYGGVVPELASRRHLEVIVPVLERLGGEVQVSIERVPYDAEAVAREVAAAGLPGEYAQKLVAAA